MHHSYTYEIALAGPDGVVRTFPVQAWPSTLFSASVELELVVMREGYIDRVVSDAGYSRVIWTKPKWLELGQKVVVTLGHKASGEI